MGDASARDRRAPSHGRAPYDGRHRLSQTDRPAGLGSSDIASAPIHAVGLIAENEPAPAPSRGLGKAMLSFARDLVIVAVLAIVMSMLIKTFLLRPFYIPSASMNDTLVVEDRVLVNLLVPDLVGIERGDIVVFEDPGNWLDPDPKKHNALQQALEFVGVLPNSGTDHLIKRVIGMPGDHVRTTDDFRIEVNGHVLDESPYLYADDGVQVAAATVPFDIVVPKDRIFVLGDHRNQSRDSRCKLGDVSQNPGMSAFVPVDNVVGASVAIVAPLTRLSTFQLPPTYAEVPAADEAPEKPILNHVEPGC